jgi:hypothetical protein
MQSMFSYTTYGASSQYQWLDCGNNFAPLSGETNPFLQFANVAAGSAGPFAVQITYNGCIDTSFCENLLSVNLKNEILNNQNVEMYPNPTTSEVSFEVNTKSSISISDAAGNIVYVGILNPETLNQKDVSNLASGIYLVNITSQNHSINKKLIINNK